MIKGDLTMSSNVRRVLVEKKPGFDVEAQGLLGELVENLGVKNLKDLRILNRYDVEGLNEQEYIKAKGTIFSEPTVDFLYEENFETSKGDRVFGIEYLPGQYDQRADSAAQCIQILSGNDKPEIQNAKLVVLSGDISESDFDSIKKYCINPVDSREASLAKPEKLQMDIDNPEDVKIIDNFNSNYGNYRSNRY
jgi:phosphoribosylformylglycinamidine synthase